MHRLTSDIEGVYTSGGKDQKVLVDFLLDPFHKSGSASTRLSCNEKAVVGVCYNVESFLLFEVCFVECCFFILHTGVAFFSGAKVQPRGATYLHEHIRINLKTTENNRLLYEWG